MDRTAIALANRLDLTLSIAISSATPNDLCSSSLVKIISRLWLVIPVAVAVTIRISYFSMYPVYVLWILLPVVSYTSLGRYIRRHSLQSYAEEE